MSEWISVKDRLPESTRAVLVWCEERKNTYCCNFVYGSWLLFGGDRLIDEGVTHWMPLPEPPEADNGQDA